MGAVGSGVPRPSHPVFAALYEGVARPLEARMVLPLRRRLLAGCTGDLLDVGAGTGANFPVLKELADAGRELRVTAAEPDAHMLRRARRRAERLGLAVRFVEAPAEALPFEDGAFDAVVSTLVLCTVADLGRSLGEMRRVLRAGGELLFIEHVRAEGRAAVWQDRLRVPWSWVAAGCQLNRDTAAAIARAGFHDLRWEAVRLPAPAYRMLVGRARA